MACIAKAPACPQGMALVDSLNGLLMLWAYEWAAENGPMHRLYFSLFLTLASCALALGIGLAEGLGQIAMTNPRLRGNAFWDGMLWVNNHLELIGLVSIGVFMSAIFAAVLLARRCVPLRKEIEEEAKAKLATNLASYVAGGEYIVRFE